MSIAPPVPYFGGKQRTAASLVALFPDHEHYVEPFAGGLSVLLAKAPSKLETVNDLDGDIVTFWRILRDRPEELERARRVWVALAQGRGGQLMRTGWRHHVEAAGTSMGLPGYLAGYLDRMPPAARRLRHVSLECRPALEVIESYGASPTALLYVDPPYLGGTRGTTHAYRHEMRDEAEHRELAEALNQVRAAVILSGYDAPLYDELYDGWDRVEFAAYSGQGNHSMAARNARTEVVWSNRPLTVVQELDLELGA